MIGARLAFPMARGIGKETRQQSNGIEHALDLKGDSQMSTTTRDTIEATSISGVMVPDSKLD